LLVRRHRPWAGILSEVLRVIVPVEPDPAADGVSATSAHAYGAAAMSAPTDPVSLAVGLIHETAHSLLNATTLLFDLVRPSRVLGYSPWRDDPRPASGVLHGAYAYLAVTRFWRTEAALGGDRLAQFEFARWRSAVAAATDSLLAAEPDTVLTPVGRRFVGALRDEVGRWREEPVDDEVERLAGGANVDHRVRWRLRNLRVPDEAIRTLVSAWEHGRPVPGLPEPEVVAGVRRLEVSGRLDLVRGRLRDGAQGDQRVRAGGGVRPGDVAWLGGEYGTSRDAYLWALEKLGVTAPPTEIDAALAGLALVAPHRALRERPEVVRAMWLARSPRPALDELLEWLD
jgi:hypothetical protein